MMGKFLISPIITSAMMSTHDLKISDIYLPLKPDNAAKTNRMDRRQADLTTSVKRQPD